MKIQLCKNNRIDSRETAIRKEVQVPEASTEPVSPPAAPHD